MLIVVAGMHRSGTSVLMRLLKDAGARIPGEMLPGNADNPTGYWEARDVVRLDNRMLAAAGHSWCDDRALAAETLDRLDAAFGAEIDRTLAAICEGGGCIAMKDPRLSRLMPLWLGAARRLGIETRVLIALRAPAEVAGSLFQRIHTTAFRPAALLGATRAHVLTARSMLEAERHARGVPRAFIDFPDLLADPRGTLARAIRAADLPLTMPEGATAVDPALHRQRGGAGAGWASARFADGIHARLRDGAPDPAALDADLARLDSLTAETDAARGAAATHPQETGAALVRLERRFAAAMDLPQRQVTFLSGAPQSKGHIYRVQNRLESLMTTPVAAALATLGTDDPEALAADSDLIVLFRAEWSPPVEALYSAAQARGVPVIFDIDDLVFDPAYMKPGYIAYLDSLPPPQRALWEARAENYRRALAEADGAWVSTEALAEHARRVNPAVQVVPNGLAAGRIRRAEEGLKQALSRPDDGLLRIGYASGSPSHDRDFAPLAPVLADLLHRHPNLRLTLIGHIEASRFAALDAVRGQIEHRPEVPFEDLPQALSDIAINLAPLEPGNPFCDAKSELKYFEAALVGVPTVASPTPPFAAAIEDGVTGFLAATEAEWLDRLSRLIDSPDTRATLARAARRQALERFGPEAQKAALLAAIRAGLRG
ncbi:glycosyltransferase family protein [Tropicibacter sp. S64]|uniref:glycosyltransferase family protein n=1 Tax=Tropicibacter sp. S64 TaxID=3415122 RepID=UPI003C7C3A8D